MQLTGLEALIAYVAEYVELGVGEHWLWQSHHLAVAGIRRQYAVAHSADVFRQTHHQFLTYRVDGRVGDLSKLLTEIVEEHLRTVAQDSKRSVVAHSGYGFLSSHSHRDDGAIYILLSVAELHQFPFVILYGIIHMATTLELLQLYAVGAQPFSIRVCLGELFLYLAIVIYPALLGVDKQYLAWLQSALAHHIGRVYIHHSHL